MLVLADAGYWFVVHFLNHVAASEAGFGCGAGLIDVVDHHAADAGRELQLLRDIRFQLLDMNAIKPRASIFREETLSAQSPREHKIFLRIRDTRIPRRRGSSRQTRETRDTRRRARASRRLARASRRLARASRRLARASRRLARASQP